MRTKIRYITLCMIAASLCGCLNSERGSSLQILKADDNPIAEEVLAASVNAERTKFPSDASMSDLEQILRMKFPSFKFKEIQQRGNIHFFCFDVGGARTSDPGSPANILNSVIVDLDKMSYVVYCMAKS